MSLVQAAPTRDLPRIADALLELYGQDRAHLPGEPDSQCDRLSPRYRFLQFHPAK
jgi:hypothetical protein